jgi:thiamine pyrophosphokinase
MKQYILFLHGQYRAGDLDFYKSRCRGKHLVAVDGGYSFFKKVGLAPHILIGDFDSLARIPRDLSKKTKVIKHPAHKDKTDAELAIDYCIADGAEQIEMIQPSFGEPDQFVGNLMLLAQYAERCKNPGYVCLSIVNRTYQAFAMHGGRYRVKGKPGDMVSVVPLSDQITLSWTGTTYDVANARISRGESRSLRNSLAGAVAQVRVTGLALLIHQLSPSKRR